MDKIKQKKLTLTPRDPLSEQTPSSARGSARGNGGRQTARNGLSAKPDSRDDHSTSNNNSKPSTSLKRRGSKNSIAVDESEVSGIADQEGTASCCNMKLSDLRADAFRDACYNPFEARILDERKAHKSKHAGRSIQSIRKSPSVSTMSRFSSVGTSARSVTMITDHIMLGAKEDAENAAMLLEFGVTHVLNTAQQLPNYFPQNFVYLKLSLIDATSTNLADALESAVSFLSHVENLNGRVLIHCLAGVSRSVTLLLMHLIVRHRLPLHSAFRYVRSCRPQINPNDSFKLQLAKLEVQELRGSSVSKDADKAWDFYDWNSIKRSVPVLKAEDYNDSSSNGGGGGIGGGRLTDDDVALLQLQLDGKADAAGPGIGGRGARERQLSITSLGDAPCCVVC